jgi:hypothetical protein
MRSAGFATWFAHGVAHALAQRLRLGSPLVYARLDLEIGFDLVGQLVSRQPADLGESLAQAFTQAFAQGVARELERDLARHARGFAIDDLADLQIQKTRVPRRTATVIAIAAVRSAAIVVAVFVAIVAVPSVVRHASISVAHYAILDEGHFRAGWIMPCDSCVSIRARAGLAGAHDGGFAPIPRAGTPTPRRFGSDVQR